MMARVLGWASWFNCSQPKFAWGDPDRWSLRDAWRRGDCATGDALVVGGGVFLLEAVSVILQVRVQTDGHGFLSVSASSSSRIDGGAGKHRSSFGFDSAISVRAWSGNH